MSAAYPLADALWTMFVFFAWVIWIWLLIVVLGDLYRRADVSGWGKAGWTFFILVLPFIGVLAYLIAYGSDMAERRVADDQAVQAQADSYIRSVAGRGDPAEQIARAKELLDAGAISPTEYDTIKQRALAGT